jgi:hypothetical protein
MPHTDAEIREFLDRNPAVFAQFLYREARRDPRWLREFLWREERIRGPRNSAAALGGGRAAAG